MQKPAPTDRPIHDLLKNRWSPRAFSPRPIDSETLLTLFEAARWSPSGGNAQPWAFIVTFLGDPGPFTRLLSTLGERNQLWAKNAPVLVLSVAQSEREAGRPNPYAGYDLGQAVAHLSVQASALGVSVHQMAGFDHQKAREDFDLPAGFDPMTVFALGYDGEPDQLPDELRERELSPRARKPLGEFVFTGAWKEPILREETISNI